MLLLMMIVELITFDKPLITMIIVIIIIAIVLIMIIIVNVINILKILSLGMFLLSFLLLVG